MALATTSATGTEAGPAADRDWRRPSAASLTWLTAGAAYLLLGGVVLLVTAVQRVSPDLLTLGDATSVERLRPVATNLVFWGGLSMVGIGAALDITRRLCRAPVQLEPVARIAGALMTLAVGAGTLALLLGHSTGRPGLEYPRVFAVGIALAQVLVAVVVVRTIAARAGAGLHPALWHIAAAVVTAPMVHLAGTLPRVSGGDDALLVAFAGSGLQLLWLGGLGIGLALYAVPAACRAPLHSPGLAAAGFWGWVVVAPFAGGARLVAESGQEHLAAIGVAAGVALLVPALAVAVNLARTYADRTTLAPTAAARLGLLGGNLLAVLAALLGVRVLGDVGERLHLTLFDTGVGELAVTGAAAALILAGAYHALPGIAGGVLGSPRSALRQSALLAVGIGFAVGGLAVAGYVQGALLEQAAGGDGVEDLISSLLWLRVVGEGLLLLVWARFFQHVLSTTPAEPDTGAAG